MNKVQGLTRVGAEQREMEFVKKGHGRGRKWLKENEIASERTYARKVQT